MRTRIKTSLFLLLNLLAPLCAHAQNLFQPISLPDASYLSGTTKLTINAPNAYFVGALSDSTVTASFSAGGGYFPPISASTFASWSSPPYSESSDPGQVLYYSDAYLPGRSLYISFSRPLQTFGVEIEVELWNTTGPITATFFNGAASVGSITQTIGGFQGARLFAAHTDTGVFDSVVIYDPSSSSGFGIGQFRYEVVPEPTTAALVVLASCFIWSRSSAACRRALHSTAR
jgi:hypothetical protein